MNTREEFHRLIDDIQDENMLKVYFLLIVALNNRKAGELWEDLSDEQKSEILLSDDESLNPDNLMGHRQVKKQRGI